MSSLVTSFVGGGPDGGVTVGSLESGPLVGVVAVVPVGRPGRAGLDLASASAALFSTPTPMLLEELLEPQPAMRTAAASVARPRAVRERMA